MKERERKKGRKKEKRKEGRKKERKKENLKKPLGLISNCSYEEPENCECLNDL